MGNLLGIVNERTDNMALVGLDGDVLTRGRNKISICENKTLFALEVQATFRFQVKYPNSQLRHTRDLGLVLYQNPLSRTSIRRQMRLWRNIDVLNNSGYSLKRFSLVSHEWKRGHFMGKDGMP